MLTICTVSHPILEETGVMDIFQQSILEKLKLANEVIVVQFAGDDFETMTGGVRFKYVNCQINVPMCPDTQGGTEHAFALHRGLEEVTNDFVMFSDPDLFFYAEVDRIYLEIIQQHSLDMVGVSHQDAASLAHRFFPVITNMIVKRKSLPPKDWLKNKIRVHKSYHLDDNTGAVVDGMYLIPGAVPSLVDKYPNPDGRFETGNLLLPWALETEIKWLSFQTPDCHNYFMMYNKSNVKSIGKLPKQPLLFHSTHSVTLEHKRNLLKEAFQRR